jgi:ATP-dependent protease HslVU (ClpYQ) peptidase subunit
MTTLAFDGRYIAADGRCTSGSMIVGKNAKKLILIHGIVRGEETEMVLAGAGSFEGITIIKNWLESGGDFFSQDPEATIPDVKECGVEGFVVTKAGELFGWEPGLVPLDQEVPAMGGSGGPFAMAAMVAGKNAVGAVHVAMELDIGSGGQVTCFDTHAWAFIDPNDTLEIHPAV